MNKAAIFRSLAHSRRSVKWFEAGRSIPEETMRDVLESTLRSPSSFNLQPTQIILVQDHDRRLELSTAMLGKGNQGRVKDCSTVAVFLSDLQADKRINRIQQLENGKRHPTYVAMMPITSAFLLGQGHAATLLKQITTDLASNLQPMPGIDPILAWSYKNTALAVQSYVFAAQSHELATCIMEGFDPRRVADILDIPHRYGIPMMVATGYERDDMKGQATPRLDVSEIVFGESFGVPYGDDNDKTNVQEGDDKEMSA